MSLKLLLADNSDLLKNVLELSLSERDIELIMMPNGTEVLMQLKELNPDILLADVALPGVDGYSICEVIKKDPGLSATKVFLIHDSHTQLDETKAQNSGYDGSLAKPFNAEALFALIESHGIDLEEPVTETAATTEDDIFQVDEVQEEIGEEPLTIDIDVKDEVSFADIASSESAEDVEVDVSGDETIADESVISDTDAVDLTADFSDSEMAESGESADTEIVMEEDLDLGSIEISEVSDIETDTITDDVPLADASEEHKSEHPFATEEETEETERDILTADTIQDVGDLTSESLEESIEEGEAPAAAVEADLASDQGRELVEEIVKKLSDDVIREVAWEVVPDLAERMIKEALDKITK